MVRSDEFFNLIVDLEKIFFINKGSGDGIVRSVNQATLNSYNYRHNLPMERIETISFDKSKDIFLEFFYFPVKPVSNPETHFNLIDVYYNSGKFAYQELLENLGESYTLDKLYEWRINHFNKIHFLYDHIEEWLERISKIKSHFKNR